MQNQVYWIDWSQTGNALRDGAGRLGTMPRPSSYPELGQSMKDLRSQGVDALISAIPRENAMLMGLMYEGEEAEKAGISFYDFPIKDRTTPPLNVATVQLADVLLKRVRQGEGVVTHCYAGIGRATLLAGMVMIRAGFSTTQTLRLISEARGLSVPDTRQQVDWLKRFEQVFGASE